MAKSYRDGKGKRTNGEIGRIPALFEDRIVLDFGWSPVGNPRAKRSAKRAASRLRRLADKNVIVSEIYGE